MRKRFISALLALAMFFSAFPTVFASVEYTGGETAPDNAPIKKLTINYGADGTIGTITIEPSAKHSGAGLMSVAIVPRIGYKQINAFELDSYTDDEIVTNYVAEQTAAYDIDNVAVNGSNLHAESGGAPIPVTTLSTIFPFFIIEDDKVATSGEHTFSGAESGTRDFSIDGIKSYLTNKSCVVIDTLISADDDNGNDYLFDASTNKQIMKSDIEAYTAIPVRVYVASGAQWWGDYVYYDTEIKVGKNGKITIPEGGDTPSEDTAIPSVALDVTAPKIGATPATTATTSTTGVVANPAVTWDPADSKFAKNQEYKASVTLSADSGYKFTDSTTATINGKTATVTLNSDGTLKAEYTFDAIKLTGISSNKTGLISSFAPNDSYTPPLDLKVTLTYSDGTTEDVPYSDFPSHNLSLVIGADTSSAVDLPAKLTLGNNNQTVYVKYSGTDTNDGNPKYQAIDTITVANAKITTAQVSVTYPKPGGTPDTVATVPSDANYTAEVTWQDSDGTDVTGNFEYDKAYNAIITVKPNTGYALDNTNGVTLTVKDKTAINPGADKPATIVSDDIDVDGSGVKLSLIHI